MVFALAALVLTPIGPGDPRIAYIGRFDRTDPSVARCQWSASEVRLAVKGSKLVAELEESPQGADEWQVVLDGKPTEVLKPEVGTHSYTIDLGADQSHEVRLVKRTEPFVGTTGFRSFDAPGGRFERARPRRRNIEIVGDSISCGFGNEGADQNQPFRPETENAYQAYGSIAARSVNADVTIIAWSGRKMWPNNTTPEIYDRILPTNPTPLYDFKGPAPQAVVINLATNDFGAGNPDEKNWTGAYETFIRRVWSHCPKAHIYAAIGSMMNDNYPAKQNALTTLRGYLVRMVGRIDDPRLSVLEFAPQRMEDGIGASWHPSVKTHEIMAARLTKALKNDLGW